MRRTRATAKRTLDGPELPKYSIAVAADLSGLPAQQLRRMEEGGLVSPRRSSGNTRRYSDNDLQQIAAVAALADDGINAAGIKMVLHLREELSALRGEVEELRRQMAELMGGATSHASEGSANGAARPSSRSARGASRPASGDES